MMAMTQRQQLEHTYRAGCGTQGAWCHYAYNNSVRDTRHHKRLEPGAQKARITPQTELRPKMAALENASLRALSEKLSI